MSNSKALIARGIGKTVRSGDRDLVILRDIDLAVDSGEALAIVGASGSGKSTLLAILAVWRGEPPEGLDDAQEVAARVLDPDQDNPGKE